MAAANATRSALSNPFPGLRPFRESEEHLFFGRENQVDVMVDKLAKTRFLAVVGTSGSGKSSLVNCGLRPALRRGLMAEAGTSWRVSQFRPGGDPIRNVSRALATDLPFTSFDLAGLSVEDMVEASLRMSKLGLADVCEQCQLGDDVNLLVIIDQFEELFRYRRLRTSADGGRDRSEDANAFVNLLLEAAHQSACPIYVVITIRSDFLGDCAEFYGLPEAMNEGQYLVPRLTREERRAAIAGPVGVAGGEISPLLLTRLVNDVGDNPDQLSILQHALNRTWSRWHYESDGSGALEVRHYEAIGTMAHALDYHAERAYAELETQRDKEICEKIFKALTDRGTDARGIRRPMQLSSLCTLADATAEEVTRVIDVFRKPSRSFVMPPAPELLQPGTVIDIAHESLMRVWARLTAWADEEAQSARLYHRLSETADLYAQGRAGLWRDPDLQLAVEWQERERPKQTWAELYGGGFENAMSFLAQSEAQRGTEVRERDERQRREAEQAQALSQAVTEARAARRLRRLSAWLGAAAFLAVVSGVVAWNQRNKAKELRDQTDSEHWVERVNDTLGLNVVFDAERAILLALHALTLYPSKPTVEKALREALKVFPLEAMVQSPEGTPRTSVFSPDGKRLTVVSVRSDRDAGGPVLWAAPSGKLVAHLILPANIHTFTVSPDERYLAMVRSDSPETVHLWDIAKAESFGVPLKHDRVVTALAFSGKADFLASATDQSVQLWDIRKTTGGPLGKSAITGQASALQLSADAGLIATLSSPGGTGKGTVFAVWDRSAVKKTTKPCFDIPTRDVTSIALSPDGHRLATIGSNGDAYVSKRTDVRDCNPPPRDFWRMYGRDIRSAIFSSNSDRIATVFSQRNVDILDGYGDRRLATISGTRSQISNVTISPDGRRVATVTADGNVRIWSTDNQPVKTSGRELIELAYSRVTRSLTRQECDAYGIDHGIISKKCDSFVIVQHALEAARAAVMKPQATEQDVNEAVRQLHEAKTADPRLKLDPQEDAKRLAAVSLIRTARQIAQKSGNAEEVAAALRQAQSWEPGLQFDTQEVNRLIAARLVEQGRTLALDGDVPGAITCLRKARQLDNMLDLNPEVDAQKTAAPALVQKGGELARQGKVHEAAQLISRAVSVYASIPGLDSDGRLRGQAQNDLCWIGSVAGHASEVMTACENAVRLAGRLKPDDWQIRDSRGLARALTGNISGAIEDFRFLVVNTDDERLRLQRQGWVKMLENGRNPFTPDVMKELRNQ
jgi:hypothetical protein